MTSMQCTVRQIWKVVTIVLILRHSYHSMINISLTVVHIWPTVLLATASSIIKTWKCPNAFCFNALGLFDVWKTNLPAVQMQTLQTALQLLQALFSRPDPLSMSPSPLPNTVDAAKIEQSTQIDMFIFSQRWSKMNQNKDRCQMGTFTIVFYNSWRNEKNKFFFNSEPKCLPCSIKVSKSQMSYLSVLVSPSTVTSM